MRDQSVGCNGKAVCEGDPRKAYDSVPRQALWLVLEKYGIPPLLVRLIQSLHDGMEWKVEVCVDSATTPVIEVNNGLR